MQLADHAGRQHSPVGVKDVGPHVGDGSPAAQRQGRVRQDPLDGGADACFGRPIGIEIVRAFGKEQGVPGYRSLACRDEHAGNEAVAVQQVQIGWRQGRHGHGIVRHVLLEIPGFVAQRVVGGVEACARQQGHENFGQRGVKGRRGELQHAVFGMQAEDFDLALNHVRETTMGNKNAFGPARRAGGIDQVGPFRRVRVLETLSWRKSFVFRSVGVQNQDRRGIVPDESGALRRRGRVQRQIHRPDAHDTQDDLRQAQSPPGEDGDAVTLADARVQKPRRAFEGAFPHHRVGQFPARLVPHRRQVPVLLGNGVEEIRNRRHGICPDFPMLPVTQLALFLVEQHGQGRQVRTGVQLAGKMPHPPDIALDILFAQVIAAAAHGQGKGVRFRLAQNHHAQHKILVPAVHLFRGLDGKLRRPGRQAGDKIHEQVAEPREVLVRQLAHGNLMWNADVAVEGPTLPGDVLEEFADGAMRAQIDEHRRHGHLIALPLVQHLAFAEGDGVEDDNLFFVAHEGDDEGVQGREIDVGADAVLVDDPVDDPTDLLPEIELPVAGISENIGMSRPRPENAFFRQTFQVTFPEL